MTTNTINIDIDINDDYASRVNCDMLYEIMCNAFDTRLFTINDDDIDNDIDIEIRDAIKHAINAQIESNAYVFHDATITNVIVEYDVVDAYDFMFTLTYESSYVDTTSTYTTFAFMSYDVNRETNNM